MFNFRLKCPIILEVLINQYSTVTLTTDNTSNKGARSKKTRMKHPYTGYSKCVYRLKKFNGGGQMQSIFLLNILTRRSRKFRVQSNSSRLKSQQRKIYIYTSKFDGHNLFTIMTTTRLVRLDVVKAVYTRAAITEYVANVARFLGSEVDSISGIVPMVQSQHKSHGNISNQALMLTR